MAMHTPHPLAVGQLLTVNLYLPPLEAYMNSPEVLPTFCEEDCEAVTILARVVWSTPLKDNGHKAGLEFYDVDRHNLKRLKHFLVEYELDEKITP